MFQVILLQEIKRWKAQNPHSMFFVRPHASDPQMSDGYSTESVCRCLWLIPVAYQIIHFSYIYLHVYMYINKEIGAEHSADMEKIASMTRPGI